MPVYVFCIIHGNTYRLKYLTQYVVYKCTTKLLTEWAYTSNGLIKFISMQMKENVRDLLAVDREVITNLFEIKVRFLKSKTVNDMIIIPLEQV